MSDVQTWRVSIGASPVGSQGTLYWVKRTYTIEARESDANDVAIARAYQDGDIEHVRVERRALVDDMGAFAMGKALMGDSK